MIFEATSVYNSEGCAPPPLGAFSAKSRPGAPTPGLRLYNFRACSAEYLTHKNSQG